MGAGAPRCGRPARRAVSRPVCGNETNPALSVERKLLGTSKRASHPARPVPAVAPHGPRCSADACRNTSGRRSFCPMQCRRSSFSIVASRRTVSDNRGARMNRSLLSAAALLFSGASLLAHHSWPVSYSRLVTVKGTVTSVSWVNPQQAESKYSQKRSRATIYRSRRNLRQHHQLSTNSSTQWSAQYLLPT